jgi:Skp family chaperone for outer membrane proteins
MKKILRNVAVAPVALALCSLWLSAGAALAADQKIATVDLAKVFDKYYKTVRSTQALKLEAADMEKEGKEMVDSAKKQEEEWHKLIDKAEDQAVSAEERAKSKKAAEEKFRELRGAEESIKEYNQAASTRLQEKRRQRTEDILKEIRGVLDVQAKAGGYTLVLDVSGDSVNSVPTPIVIYTSGVNDLTESVIKELNAGAPLMSSDDKEAQGAKGAK